MAALAVFAMLAMVVAPAVSEEVSADGSYYYYRISTDGTITVSTDGENFESVDSIGSSTAGPYSSTNNSNSGFWTYDGNGIGPFNSFYAAFDPYNDNAFVCILDPDDLTKSIDGEDISEYGYNIMWVLPTVYWCTDDDGSLILTNDSSYGDHAYAHLVDGDTYDYLAIGVYEASAIEVDGETFLASISGATPVTGETRSTYRGWAASQTIENGEVMVWNLYQYELYKYCATIAMGGWNSQGVGGYGNVTSGTASTTGTLDASGPYAGNTDPDSSDPVKVFIENAWGSVAEMIEGVFIEETTRTFYIDASSEPTDSNSGTYVTSSTANLASTGWGSDMSTTLKVWGLPTDNKGSDSTGTCDYVKSGSGQHILVVGGDSNAEDPEMYGLSYIDATYGLNDKDDTVGTRLAFVYDDEGEESSDDSMLMWIAVAAIIIVAVAAVGGWAYRTGRI